MRWQCGKWCGFPSTAPHLEALVPYLITSLLITSAERTVATRLLHKLKHLGPLKLARIRLLLLLPGNAEHQYMEQGRTQNLPGSGILRVKPILSPALTHTQHVGASSEVHWHYIGDSHTH